MPSRILFWLPLCLLFMALLPASGLAQLDNVMVYGTVKDMSTAKKLDGVTVTVYKNGAKLVDVVTNASGKYEVNLDYGADFKIMCSKPGFVGKNITIDTRNVPDEERIGGHGMNIDFTMMAEIQGVDYSVLLEPFGMAKYVPASGNFEWDMEYTARMRDAQARLLKEYEDRKKREASAEADFAKAMQQGDNAMAASDFKKAVESFTKALDIKPGDPVATARLSDAQIRYDAQDSDKKLNEQYAALIKEADALFTKKDLETAKAKYTEALTLKEEEAHPKARIKEIDVLLAELAKKAEEERLAKELQEKYDAVIAAADAAFGSEDLDQAEARYTEASGLKPQEKYPKDQLAAVAAKRQELAKRAEEEKLAQELQQKYDAAIAAADASFNSENWDAATAKYNEASTLKPEETYPKDQLAAIQLKKEEAARKAEEEKLAKELQEQYQAVIKAADASFNSGDLDAAGSKYNEALGLKPEEAYPKDQIAAIARKREELAAQAEEEQRAKELQAKYDAAIAAADAAFNSEQWEEATAKYTEASGVKPEETYPKNRLAQIEAKLAELAAQAEEEQRARELEERYNAAIAEADQAFDGSDWSTATTRYTEASGLKPGEAYPKDRLAEIEKRIAEENELRKQQELDEQYNAAIAAADASFAADALEEARAKYQEASGLKPGETHPKDRISEIDALIAQRAAEEEAERKRQELEDRYNALITSADQAYTEESFSAALNDYKDALKLKPEEQYPKDRIADIETKLDEAAQAKAEEERLLREQQERDARYQDLITTADKAFGASEWEKASADYQAALEVKPEEAYPQQRLDEIQRMKADAEEAARLAAEREAELARQAELDSLAALQEAEERARQAERDRLAALEAAARQAELDSLAALEEARRQAELDSLAALEDAAERARREEEERLRMEAEADRKAAYDAHIAAADRAYSGNEYDLARQKYQDALAVMPDAQHPKDRLAAIDDALAALDAEAEERRRREQEEAEARRQAEEEERRRREAEQDLEKNYADNIAEADLALAEQRYTEAREYYSIASDLKPGETYPLSKIDQIDRILEEEEKRRQEELAAEQARQEREKARQNNSTTIDIRKEQEAESFMRAAREREEAEKYERIKKFKSDLELSENEMAENAAGRRADGVAQRDRHLENSVGLYTGDEARRRQNADEMDAWKEALAQKEAERIARAAELREQNKQDNEAKLEQKASLDRQWDDRHKQQTREMSDRIEDLQRTEEERAQRGLQKNRDYRDQAEALAEQNARMRQRGDEITQERYRQLQEEKRLLELRETQLRNNSESTRQRNKEDLDNIPRNQPKAFADHNRSKLAMEYPPGVTEESYTEGNKVIIRRVVVNGNKADEYSKVIAKWGTFYFKNGQSITEAIWSQETEG